MVFFFFCLILLKNCRDFLDIFLFFFLFHVAAGEIPASFKMLRERFEVFFYLPKKCFPKKTPRIFSTTRNGFRATFGILNLSSPQELYNREILSQTRSSKIKKKKLRPLPFEATLV